MLNIYRKSLLILKNNLLFIQPLLLFLLMLITALSFIVSRNILLIPKIVLLISMFLLLIAFSAGWFYINKYGVETFNESDTKEESAIKAVNNFKKFFEGVGFSFIKTAFSYFLLFILYFFVIFLSLKLCLHFYGEPKIVYELPKLSMAASQAEIFDFLNGIPDKDKVIFSLWMLTFNFITTILHFFILLFFAVLNFEGFNIFKSLWISIKFFFKNFFCSIAIMIFSFILYVFLNILSVLLGANSLSFVILIILFTMYLNYYLLLVFCFYYDKAKNNSNSRTEFIG